MPVLINIMVDHNHEEAGEVALIVRATGQDVCEHEESKAEFILALIKSLGDVNTSGKVCLIVSEETAEAIAKDERFKLKTEKYLDEEAVMKEKRATENKEFVLPEHGKENPS